MTVIIPTFNRSRLVVSVVEQVLRQDTPDVQVLVIDQSDSEQQARTADALRGPVGAGRVCHVRLDRVGVANARNEGLARAIGRVVVFLDDDVILLSPSVLRAHLRCYEDPSVGGVCGRTIERVLGANARQTTNRITFSGRTLVNLAGRKRCEIHSLKGANMSVRAEAIAGLDGFDRNYTGTALLEEADFSERINRRGWRLVFEPEAEIIHLSAAFGGVRVGRAEDVEFYRFRSTAYFVRKHRGTPSLLAFAVTHTVVALLKAVQLRRSRLPLHLLRGAKSGLALVRRGADQLLPTLNDGVASRADALDPSRPARAEAATASAVASHDA